MMARQLGDAVRESAIEKYLLAQCRAHRMLCLKFTSPARGGVPDRIIISPTATVFLELKRPGEDPDSRQVATHAKMRRFGAEVFVASQKDHIDALIADLCARSEPIEPSKMDQRR